MALIPFPPQLASQSASAAAASLESRKGLKAGDHETAGVACYRAADGEFRMAYDLYRPEYPEGAEPGIGTIAAKLEWYPNDTQGYKIRVTDFTPAHELLEKTETWSNPAAAIVTTNGNSVFFLAPSQDHLNEIIHVPAGSDIPFKRPHVQLTGDRPSAPEAAVFMNPAGRDTVLLGKPMDIAEALMSRYDVGMPKGAPEKTGLSPDEEVLHQLCCALNDRYAFDFKMCDPDNLVVMNEVEAEISYTETPAP
ncbi:hypothetical protein ACGYLO_19105 [Sulfitobacter sp. 1A13353]|jgi:hypothetical protein|uniref:hypothetical protein n=1 Tax=Sulfitobacter sp. 1A13353 TaxID=3368568 RepID=UPI003746DC9D